MLIVFTRQLYILIKAGVPLLKALQIIHVQLAAGKFKESLDFIIHEIQDGRSFSEALIAHPKFFSLFYINMIKAAEVSGNLVAVLKELSVHLIEHRRLNRQVQSAIMYPVFILLTATSILLVLLVFVLPVFTRIFQDLGANLPPATQFLVWVSNLLLRWGWLVLIVGALAGVTIFTLARRPRGRAILDGLFWRIPLFGKIYKTMEIARLCRTIGTLLTSGVVLIKALEVLIDITPAVLLRQGLEDIRYKVEQGKTLSAAIEETNLFPLTLVKMIQVGEETGKIAELFLDASEDYESEVSFALTGLLSLLEPVLIVVMGAIVGFIVIALFFPIFTMGSLIR